MANVSKYQRDVVITCNHGITDRKPDYVSRYRFMQDQEAWVSVDRGGTESTEVGGADDGWFPAKEASGPRHTQQKTRCRTCGKEISITAERLEDLLSLIAPQTDTVTIAELQKVLRHSASKRRR
ncbi:hypothetical protein ACRCUN_17120 [Mycobacterium sp. LTG2003]